MAHTRRAVAEGTFPNEIDVDVLAGRPMALKIVEDGGPVGRQVPCDTIRHANDTLSR